MQQNVQNSMDNPMNFTEIENYFQSWNIDYTCMYLLIVLLECFQLRT